MIFNTKLGITGRLGNQLFQYAALRSKALDLQCNHYMINLDNVEYHGQKSFLPKFNIKYNIIPNINISNIFIEGRDNFDTIKNNTDIIGNFESEQYFKKYKDIIKKEFQIKDKVLLKKCRNIMNKIRKKYKNFVIIGIHIRRGDALYKKTKRDYCCDKLTKDTWLYQYLLRSFNIFNDIHNKKFLIFTGGSRSQNNSNITDIKWCKNNFKGSQYIFSENNNTLDDFILMTMCDHLILNSASTFGWWAGYLNKNPNKRIICPILPNLEKDWENYWSNEFIVI